MIYGIPADWAYNVKKALNYRIYANPLYLCSLSEIVHKHLEATFGVQNIQYYKLNDADRSISFRIANQDANECYSIMDRVHAACVVEFCMTYKNEIYKAIYEVNGKSYADIFLDMILNDHPTLISQFSIYFGHPIIEGGLFCTQFRLY